MVDIHCHILPGLDDGARALEESVAMANLAAESGTTDLVATPHANHEFAFSPELVKQKIAELESACGGVLRIHRGCDFHLSASNINDALENPSKYTINGKSYLLVEFPDTLIPSATGTVFDHLMQMRITPIITHPERHPVLQQSPERLRKWVEDGCCVQVTAHSFLGRFGSRAKRAAEQMMSHGWVHIVASDAHDPVHRPPVLRDAFDLVARGYGKEAADLAFIDNPAATLSGAPVLALEIRRRRSWFLLSRSR